MGHRKCLPSVCDQGSFWREHPTGLVFCGATWEQGSKASYELTVLLQVLAGTGSLTSVNRGPHIAKKLRHSLVCLHRWRSQALRQEPPAQGLSGRQSQDPQQLLCFPSPELKRRPPQCPVRTLTCTAHHKGPRDQLVLLSFTHHPEWLVLGKSVVALKVHKVYPELTGSCWRKVFRSQQKGPCASRQRRWEFG